MSLKRTADLISSSALAQTNHSYPKKKLNLIFKHNKKLITSHSNSTEQEEKKQYTNPTKVITTS